MLLRVENYLLCLLMYITSLYHFVFGWLAIFAMQAIWGYDGSRTIFEYIGLQEYKLRLSMLPIYGFMTFAFMSGFMVLDYWVRRRLFNQNGVRAFLKAYIMSQLAYIGYSFHLYYYVKGIQAVTDGIFFWFLHIPMLFVCFPLSLFIFQKVIQRILGMECKQKISASERSSKSFVLDYLIFSSVLIVYIVMSY